MSEEKRSCQQSGCQVQATGKCVEGFSLSPNVECPHYKVQLVAETEEELSTDELLPEDGLDSDEAIPTPILVHIPYGDDLSAKSCRRIMSRSLTRVIVLAGDPDSGKTTLLTAIYEKFLDGAFAGYLFAGSETFPGFEERCHPARVASYSSHPDTVRTTREKYLHVKVRRKGAAVNGVRDILFSDIPGEDFERARNAEEFCRQMSVIKRADHLLLFLDGERLASLTDRNKTITNGRTLLRSFLDAEMLGSWSIVDVLFTKYDKMQAKLRPEEIEKIIAHSIGSISTQCAGRLQKIRFHRIAARPDSSSSLNDGYGLEELFPSWVEDSAQFVRLESCSKQRQTTGREFDLFLERELPNYC